MKKKIRISIMKTRVVNSIEVKWNRLQWLAEQPKKTKRFVKKQSNDAFFFLSSRKIAYTEQERTAKMNDNRLIVEFWIRFEN